MHILPWTLRTRFDNYLMKRSWTVSQVGQDHWVFGDVFNEKVGGYFLDIGAHDGITISNTFVLERRYKWSGLCIEANPITFEKLKVNRNAVCLNICLDSVEGECDFALRDVLGGIVDVNLDNDGSKRGVSIVKLKTKLLINVLKENLAPRIIDYMSIDVEGAEERILMDFDFDLYRFNCITIERPTHELRKLLDGNGYELIREIRGLDCFYVHKNHLAEYKENLFAFHRKKKFLVGW